VFRWSVAFKGIFECVDHGRKTVEANDPIFTDKDRSLLNWEVSSAEIMVSGYIYVPDKDSHELIVIFKITDTKDLIMTVRATFRHIFSYFRRDMGFYLAVAIIMRWNEVNTGDWMECSLEQGQAFGTYVPHLQVP
jgi:hypothetical protein